MRRIPPLLPLLVLPLSSCVAEVPRDDDARALGADEHAETELPMIDPCDPAWLLPPTFAPLDPDPTVQAFTSRMSAAGAQWVGRGDRLAIVRVDEPDKSKPFLWHLVVYPTTNAAAASTVSEYSARFPVWSKPIGYCWSDGRMHATKPPYGKPSFVVAEWDPGCNCTPLVTGRLTDLAGGRTTTVFPRTW